MLFVGVGVAEAGTPLLGGVPLLNHTCNIINMRRSGGTPRRASLVFIAVATLLLGAFMGVAPAQHADAAIAATFDPGNIIDDSVFYNSTTMSAQQVQDFLNSKVAGCVGGYTCLKNYTTATSTRAAVANLCTGYTGASSETAAQIIWNVAQSCGINPQVLIVLLQKEQGLVTSNAPSAGSYQTATGYGCPDTAVCDSLYYGFFNQVYAAAYQFKLYRAYPSSYNFVAGRTNSIQYSPNSACGTASVFIANQATAGLYDYTPYTPNAAAMANLYGSGDGCSAYGNRNFWAYFIDWFGPTTGDIYRPFGSLDVASGGLGKITVAGWTIDPDTTAPLSVHVYVDGVGAAVTIANISRPDVGAAYPADGPNHGFSVDVDASPGPHDVCVYAINVGAGTGNTTLGCQNLTVLDASPSGAVASISPVPGAGVQLTGWAADPETSAPIDVRVYVDGGNYLGDVTASATSSLVASGLAASVGTAHGFSVILPAPAGVHSYCAWAINIGRGGNTMIGCGSANLLAGSPMGSLDSVQLNPGAQEVQGWVLDPDSTAPIQARVIVDGVVASTVTAALERADIAAAFPGYGASHGFSAPLSLGAGTHTVCVQAVNVGAGSDTMLPCRQLTVRSGSPIGSVDQVMSSGPGSLTVSGWALDYDTANSIPVHIYLDGVGVPITASDTRADIGAAFPGYGSAHGFTATVPASGGSHQLCVYAINQGPGANTVLTCRTVVMPTGAPIGSLDAVSASGSTIRLQGWALDYDTAASIQVRVYLDGIFAGAGSAAGTRQDIADSFPGYGAGHGFDLTVAATPGPHSACAWAIDSGGGNNTLLGCQSIGVG